MEYEYIILMASLFIIQLQYAHKCFLRNLHVSYLAHPLLTFLLFLQKFSLPADVTAVALGKHVFSHSLYRLSCNDLTSDRRLDRNFEAAAESLL